jgi:hypothetical protein
MSTIDVITVPDFSRDAAPRFELRTLLFLGAWLRHQGASRAWPLHLACIGDPPPGIRRLAERAGAAITIHARVDQRWPSACNKLRGFEITPTAARFLLLDVDTLVLKDLQPLAEALGERTGLGPATFNPVPEPLWERLFEAARTPYPGPTGTCWYAQYDLSAAVSLDAAGRGRCLRMPPYYNSGVVFGAWADGLGHRWRCHAELLMGHTDEVVWGQAHGAVRFADQYALATAAAQFVRDGGALAPLPLAFGARPPLLDAAVLDWPRVALFHYAGWFAPYGESVDAVTRWLYGSRLPRLRRRAARTLGLSAIRSPMLRGLPPARRRIWRGFIETVHMLIQEFGPSR